MDAVGQFAKQQVVIDEVGLFRVLVRLEAALVLHGGPQLTDDPIREVQAVDDWRLSLLLGRHFLQRDLCPHGLPSRGIGLIHRGEFAEVQIALLRVVVVAVEAVLFEERQREVFELRLNGLARRVGFRSGERDGEGYE